MAGTGVWPGWHVDWMVLPPSWESMEGSEQLDQSPGHKPSADPAEGEYSPLPAACLPARPKLLQLQGHLLSSLLPQIHTAGQKAKPPNLCVTQSFGSHYNSTFYLFNTSVGLIKSTETWVKNLRPPPSSHKQNGFMCRCEWVSLLSALSYPENPHTKSSKSQMFSHAFLQNYHCALMFENVTVCRHWNLWGIWSNISCKMSRNPDSKHTGETLDRALYRFHYWCHHKFFMCGYFQ